MFYVQFETLETHLFSKLKIMKCLNMSLCDTKIDLESTTQSKILADRMIIFDIYLSKEVTV